MRVASFGGALAAVLLASTSVVAQSAANDTTSAICEPTAGTACEPAAPATERPAATRPTADDPAYRGFGEPRFDPSSADGAPPLEPILTRIETPAFAPARSGAIAGEAQLSSQATDGRPREVESVVSDAPEAEAETVPAAEVGVTRVTLATGGLAQVEGRMNGAADTMRLAIERPQVADVLRRAYPDRQITSKVVPDWIIRLLAAFGGPVRQIINDVGNQKHFDGSKGAALLGRPYRTNDDAILSAAESAIRLELFKSKAR